MIDKITTVAKNYYKVDCQHGEDLLEKIYVLGFKRGVQKQKATQKEAFWQQYTYEHAKGNYSIIHRCSNCDFHPCDLNLGQYKFCPSCGASMTAPEGPPIKINMSYKDMCSIPANRMTEMDNLMCAAFRPTEWQR